MDRRLALALALMAGFLVVLGWVELIGAFPGDQAILEWSDRQTRAGEIWDLILLFQLLGTPMIAALTILALAVVFGRRLGLQAAAFIIAAGAAPAVSTLLKAMIGPTPPWRDLKGADAANLPSGHEAYAIAVFGAAAFLAEGRRQRDVRVIFVLLAAAMGPARLALGAHLLSDVLAGACVGGAWLLVTRGLIAALQRQGVTRSARHAQERHIVTAVRRHP